MSGAAVAYEVRQWGYWTYAAYIDDNTWWGRFVGTAHSRVEAEALARNAAMEIERGPRVGRGT